MVQSGNKWSSLKLEIETNKKTRLYSPALWDRSPVRSKTKPFGGFHIFGVFRVCKHYS